MTALKTLAMVNHDHILTVTMPQCGVAEGRYEVVIMLTPPETADRPPARQAVPDLEEYQRTLALARRQAPPSPWLTTAETMNALREGS